MSQLLLSICIPTYNRASYLKSTLDSIVCQNVFTNSNEIEIIILDNASTDDTQDVALIFVKQYPSKIKYYCNEKHIGWDNMAKALSLGVGEFLKLNNDTLRHKANTLEFMLQAIRENISLKPLLFFRNSKDKGQQHCPDINHFLKAVSYNNTWIGSFGSWKQDFSYDTFVEKNNTIIPQTYIWLDLLRQGKQLIVYNASLFDSIQPVKKGGYNIAEVFGKNYLAILKEFVAGGYLSQKIYNQEKKYILTKHINYFYFDHNREYAFIQDGYRKHLWLDYRKNPYFYISYIKNICAKANVFFKISNYMKDNQKYTQITILGFKIKIKTQKGSE